MKTSAVRSLMDHDARLCGGASSGLEAGGQGGPSAPPRPPALACPVPEGRRVEKIRLPSPFSLLVTQRPLVVIRRHYRETPETFYGVLGSSMTAAMK